MSSVQNIQEYRPMDVQPPAIPAAADIGELCKVCAGKGKSCCQGHEIYVTRGDCRRIRENTGETGFFEYRACDDASYADQDDDPVWQRLVFRPDGTRRVLKWGEDDNCHFLGNTGCRLPLEVRPLICRLFPYTYTAEAISPGWDEECPAARTRPAADVQQHIAGGERALAERYHKLLYTEIMWEGIADENWTDL